MTTVPKPLLRDLEPPSGGEARLRQALVQGQARSLYPMSARWVGLAGTSALVALALLIGLTLSRQGPGDPVGDAVRTVLAAPEERFETHAGQVIERQERAGSVRLYVLMPAGDPIDSGG